MALSSNSIIHFTGKKAALRGILEGNFKIKYCREAIKFTNSAPSLGVPMVSFCDIPLSEVKEHIGKYGNYGIGLTKEWAARKKLNPVMYLQAGSLLSESLRQILVRRHHKKRESIEEDEALINIARYSKNYEGDLDRIGKPTIVNYRYSDEREWRYVPPLSDAQELILSEIILSNADEKKKADRALSDLRLVFEPDDIRYIIIKDESEIGYFIDVLRRAKGKTYPAHDIERLSTRILTTSQIITDF